VSGWTHVNIGSYRAGENNIGWKEGIMQLGHRLPKVLLGRVALLIATALTVASLVPRSGAQPTAAETVLYSFCARGPSCVDGLGPNGGLIMDAAGQLYGTTFNGGVYDNAGTVFALTPNAAETKWTETVLHSFCAETDCIDGSSPSGGLILDKAGQLYGTTGYGGANNSAGCSGSGCGTVFELTPNAAKRKWTVTVLYSFCARGREQCADGAGPNGDLIMDKAGNLYGTTPGGGANCHGSDEYGCGVVFELTPNAAKTNWTETVLYSFCNKTNCTDGSYPLWTRRETSTAPQPLAVPIAPALSRTGAAWCSN
jgi:uncharacterized repeat protein (TIGR03803 family)